MRQHDKYKISLIIFLYSLLFVFLSHVAINTQSRHFDYVFHLTRIVGLSESISHLDFLPSLNHIFAFGTGYAVPMFYGNWQFYLPAFFFMMVQKADLTYDFFVFLLVLSTIGSSFYCFKLVTKNVLKSLIAAMIVPLYFPLFGYGMTMVMPLVPLLFYAIYKVLYLNKQSPALLGIVIALLIQTHVLSTLILAFYSFLFVILSFRKLTLKKLVSFSVSVVIGLLLSIAYLIQYIEQVGSQKFYFSWVARDFPVENAKMFNVPDLLKLKFTGLYEPFTSLFITIDIIAIVLFVYALFRFKHLSEANRKLLITIVMIAISTTSILPWQNVLKYTFLGTIQYTGRLLFFVPFLLIWILVVDFSKEWIFSLGALSALFYLVMIFSTYSPIGKLNPEHEAYISENNRNMLRYYNGDTQLFSNTSGDEYYNLDIDSLHVRDSSITQFSVVEGAEIKNIKSSYNTLEFDVVLTKKRAQFFVPRPWYKGYIAEYSQGAEGSQPTLKYQKLSNKDQERNEMLHKPKVQQKALQDGKIFLSLSQSGHVKISHHKTFLQSFFLMIEGVFWIFIFYIYYLIKRKESAKIA